MLVEVREAKAHKPDRWEIPSDLSLKSYLGKQKGSLVEAGADTNGKVRTFLPIHSLWSQNVIFRI